MVEKPSGITIVTVCRSVGLTAVVGAAVIGGEKGLVWGFVGSELNGFVPVSLASESDPAADDSKELEALDSKSAVNEDDPKELESDAELSEGTCLPQAESRSVNNTRVAKMRVFILKISPNKLMLYILHHMSI